jgi:hypothetical protein
MDDKRSYDVSHAYPSGGAGFYRQKRPSGPTDQTWWGINAVTARQAEQIGPEELTALLAVTDPDEMDPIRGRAMPLDKRPQRPRATIYHVPVVGSEMPSEIPTYVVIRETKTTARVFNTMTGRPSSKVVPISKACKIARQQNGDKE